MQFKNIRKVHLGGSLHFNIGWSGSSSLRRWALNKDLTGEKVQSYRYLEQECCRQKKNPKYKSPEARAYLECLMSISEIDVKIRVTDEDHIFTADRTSKITTKGSVLVVMVVVVVQIVWRPLYCFTLNRIKSHWGDLRKGTA